MIFRRIFLMTKQEVSAALGLSMNTIRRLEGRGIIKAVEPPPEFPEKWRKYYAKAEIKALVRAVKYDDDYNFSSEDFDLLKGKWEL